MPGLKQIRPATEFEANLSGNLYKLWNRLSSGSYFPPPVRRVDIPKANGGTRPLGVPTVADRIAQGVARRYLEPILEPVLHADSYGYRPGKSAVDAVRTARERSLLIGRYVMATAEHREPCDSRGSCTVLGAPGGEIPSGDSTSCDQCYHSALVSSRVDSRHPAGQAVDSFGTTACPARNSQGTDLTGSGENVARRQ
jgi:hypothetical protein